jgi:hypothetical protein
VGVLKEGADRDPDLIEHVCSSIILFLVFQILSRQESEMGIFQ